jgi:hypothetical protein
VDKFTVVLEGKLVEVENLPDFAESVMVALIDLGVEDPFVFTDADIPSLRVELVVQAGTQTEALSEGVRFVSEALGAVGAEATAVSTPSARAEGLSAA